MFELAQKGLPSSELHKTKKAAKGCRSRKFFPEKSVLQGMVSVKEALGALFVLQPAHLPVRLFPEGECAWKVTVEPGSCLFAWGMRAGVRWRKPSRGGMPAI
jgi:hypothetical protein